VDTGELDSEEILPDSEDVVSRVLGNAVVVGAMLVVELTTADSM
jgi:hypothetical protein